MDELVLKLKEYQSKNGFTNVVMAGLIDVSNNAYSDIKCGRLKLPQRCIDKATILVSEIELTDSVQGVEDVTQDSQANQDTVQDVQEVPQANQDTVQATKAEPQAEQDAQQEEKDLDKGTQEGSQVVQQDVKDTKKDSTQKSDLPKTRSPEISVGGTKADVFALSKRNAGKMARR